MIKNGRWRGRIPFRVRPELRDRDWREAYRRFSHHRMAGHGRAEGSYTEEIRKALVQWMKEKIGSGLEPVTFQYRLYRRKIVTVTVAYPTIFHHPEHGNGSKGFVLAARVLSVDGAPLTRLGRMLVREFAMNRIVGRESIKELLSLPEPSLSAGSRDTDP